MGQGREFGGKKNQYYALRDRIPDGLRGDEAAKAYLRYEADGVNLRANYVAIITAVAQKLESGTSSSQLVGENDDPKLRSSIRLFERISRDGFDNEVNTLCKRALALLQEP